MKTIIMAGGKGSRLTSVANDIPKPMIPICGKPILEHQLECLKNNGLTNITLVIGHLGSHIKDYFGDGKKFGCNISYFEETEPLGTAGALYKMDLPQDFILINGDIIFDIDFSHIIAFHFESDAMATLVVHPNNHPYDSALIKINKKNKVTGWINKEDERTYYKNIVNAGIHILCADLLEKRQQKKERLDLDRDIIKPLISKGKIYAYSTPEYIKDMGTPERLAEVTAAVEKGIVKQKNLSNKQKCIFLDRDGTINTPNGFVTKPEDFTLIEGAAQAIKKINSFGYLAIVITNQPVIARGDTDFETLDLIHQKMETELGKEGAFIDDLFFCPHHTDKGFAGERPELKFDCDCRKPKPGMILQAAEKYNIDLSQSYMVGDHKNDILAGLSAGCIPVFLTNNKPNEDINNVSTFNNLLEFTNWRFAEK